MSLLSLLRVGVSTGIIDEINLEKVQSLMIDINSNTLKLELKQNCEEKEEDILRADYIRKVMI